MTLDADSEVARALLRAVSDGPSSKILGSIVATGRSVEEICSETDVSVSTAYRKIHGMVDEGLAIIERVMVTDKGKRYMVYRASFSGFTIVCDQGNCKLQSTPNAGVPDITYRLWRHARDHPDIPR